jgi:hypothetical protein
VRRHAPNLEREDYRLLLDGLPAALGDRSG